MKIPKRPSTYKKSSPLPSAVGIPDLQKATVRLPARGHKSTKREESQIEEGEGKDEAIVVAPLTAGNLISLSKNIEAPQ